MSSFWNNEAKSVTHNMQQNNYQRKSVYNIYTKKFQAKKRRRRSILPAKLPYFPNVASKWVGDEMNSNPSRGHTRFWLQNCNGIKIHDECNTNHMFTQLNEYSVNYFAFTEPNINVSNPTAVSKLHRTFKNRFHSGRMSLTNTPGFPSSTSFQPGGVFSGFDSSLNSRFISSEQDPIGRWHCQTFRGTQKDIKIYTMYRVHRKTDDTAGLTTAWMQQRSALRSKNITSNPRDDVITSLCSKIRKDLDSNKSVILMGDFNEFIGSREQTHEKLMEIGLINLMQNTIESSLPKTWNRGKDAIDHVYMSVDVVKSVKKSGFAPFELIALSDHRGLFFDLDSAILFEEKLHQVEPAKFRRLQSSNMKRVKEYHRLLEDEWKNHKIDERLQKIADTIKRDGMTNENLKRLNNIDNQITDIMRHSEKKCTKISRHARDPWSPQLKELAREIRYITVQIRKTLRDLMPISIVECMGKVNSYHLQLTEKRKEYREFIKKANVHRKMHLEERAQYHVSIGKNSNAAGEVKRLSNIEQQKQDSVKINFTINEISTGAATYILIPHLDAYASTSAFDGNIYSVNNIWKRIQLLGGEDIEKWVRVTDKNILENMLIQWQVLHYTQANNTPFSDKFWTDELGKPEVSDRIIKGEYDPPASLPWEAKEILLHMKRSPLITEEIDLSTTFEDFQKFFRLAKESTSSSPSGRHYGHFKALLQTDKKYLQSIHTILSISTEHNAILDRWKPTISTLIEKIEGKPYIHKYRTIHIIESDIQFLSKQVYVLGMMKMADKFGLITDQQYGARNRRQCQSAYINKICYYDISRQKVMDSAFLDDDAKACYDRIVTRLSEVEVQKWGVSTEAAKFTTKFLHNQKFHLKTAHGTTKQSYQYDADCRIQGSGQGIGWAGPRWTASSDTISNIMSKKCTGMKFSDPTGTIQIQRNGDFFVDDLDIGVNADAINDKTKTPAMCLQEDEQIHSLVLNGIGHCLNPIKTSWYDVKYKRDGVKHIAMTNKENPGEMHIQVEFEGDRKKIKRLEPHVASKALGVFLAPNGVYSRQFEMLVKKLKKWARNVKASSLTSREKLVAYHGYILRGIIYVISATNFTKEQCNQLQKIISPILYNAYRVQRNAIRTPLYTPKSLGGYGIVSIYHLQGIEKLKFYFMHRRINDTTGQLLNISTRFTQFELGTSKQFWNLTYGTYQHYITASWTTDIWRYLHSCRSKLVDADFWYYQPPRENDFYIMDVVFDANLSIFHKQVFNQIRLYMKILTASDIIDHSTNKMKKNIIGCKSPLSSTFGFPYVKDFPKQWISIWNSIMATIIIPHINQRPLGRWISFDHLDSNVQTTTNDNADANKLEAITTDLGITSSVFRAHVEKIRDTIKKSQKWKRHIWGESKLTHSCIFKILKLAHKGDLALATDASVNDGHAAHAFCFASKSKGKVIFSSGSKVEGPTCHVNSYRAEMTSIIAATTLIELIYNCFGLCNKRISLYTDSETSITTSKNGKLNTLHFVISNDIDVALQLHHTITHCNQNVSLIHVHGHQDKDKKFHELEVPSQLNVLMDGLSKHMVDKTLHDSNTIIPMPAQTLYIQTNTNQPIAHDLTNTLIEREMKKDIATYYEKHHNISPNLLTDIDWKATKSALSLKNEVSYRKTFHKFRNTMIINKRWKRTDCDLCPMCSAAPETIFHLLSCQHKDIKYVRDINIPKIFDKLNSLNTQQDIIRQWKSIFVNITTNSDIKPPDLSMTNPISWRIIQAHQKQSEIGWEAFSNGIIASRWTDIQKDHYESNKKDGENIHRWRRIAVQLLIDLLRDLWQTRCGFINAEKIMTETEMLSQRTAQMFRDNKHHRNMLSIMDRHLFDKEEKYFYSSNQATLELWEAKVKKAMKRIFHRDKNQPQLKFNHEVEKDKGVEKIKPTNAEKINDVEPTFKKRLARIREFVSRTKNMRKKRKLTNGDPTWSKRLRLTQSIASRKKRRKSMYTKNEKKLKENLVVPTNNITCDIIHYSSSKWS